MRIGVVYNQDVCNAHYRAIWPMAGLADRGHEVVFCVESPDGRQLDTSPLHDCDLVHVYRSGNPALARLLGQLRQKRGTVVTFDNDDDHRLIPQGSPDRDRFTGFTGDREFRFQAKMMQRAAVVTTTTAKLGERLALDFKGPIEVIENQLAPFQFVKGRADHEGILIGWVAGKEHRADAQKLGLTQMLRRVMERDQRVRVETAGVRLDLDPDRYNYAGIVPFERLPEHMARWDIGIAPIADLAMSHVRSSIKVKEYSAAGVPWVASARGSYRSIADGCGGLLVADDAWEETLVSLAGARLRRRRLRRQAQAWAETQRVERHLDRWESVVQMALATGARQVA